MERQTIDITIRDFQADDASAMDCHIVVGHIGLSACIRKNHEIRALRGWHFDQANKARLDVDSAFRDMNTVLATEPIFDYDFESISIFFSTPWATLVPNRLFDSGTPPKTYLSLLTQENANLEATSTQVNALDSYLVYGIEKPILKLLLSKFPNARFSHIGHPLLLAWRKKIGAKGTGAFINFSNHIAQMAVYSRGELLFFNTFGFTSPADFLYFALLPFNQLNLNPLDVPLTLSGEIVEYAALHKVLMRYVRTIHFMPENTDLDLPGAVRALPEHFHFDLFSSIGIGA